MMQSKLLHWLRHPQPLLSQTLPVRWTLLVLLFLGVVLAYLYRANLSVAIISMSDEFHWDKTTQGFLLSAFFYGYSIGQIPGGYLATKYGAKQVLLCSVVLSSIITIATPAAASLCDDGESPTVLMILRALLGFSQAPLFPSCYHMIAQWIPVGERSRASSLISSGTHLGVLLTSLAAAPLLSGSASNWRSVFYLFGVLGALYIYAWHRYAQDSPHQHPDITKAELELYNDAISPTLPAKHNTASSSNLIDNNSTDTTTKPSALRTASSVPWGALLRQPPVWALIINHFCANWGLYLLLTWMPTYLSSSFAESSDTAIDKNHAHHGHGHGVAASAFPWLVMFISANGAGWLADTILRTGHLSITAVRKLMQSIGLLGPAAMLTVVSIGVVHTLLGATAAMSAALALSSFALSGYGTNHLDLTPKYAGVLMGVTNMGATMAGIFGVPLTGYILDSTGSQWGAVFAVATAIYVAGTLVWLLFASGERLVLDRPLARSVEGEDNGKIQLA